MAKIDVKSAKCQEAIRLKYSGESYEVISKKIKTPIDTIKGWFRSEGPLREEYDTYTDEQNEFRLNESNQILKRNIHTAANMLVALMGSPDDNVKFRATKEMLDRVQGSPKQTIEHEGLFGTDLSYEQILRKAREKPPPDG
jgi:predicted metal-dependent hydrolase